MWVIYRRQPGRGRSHIFGTIVRLKQIRAADGTWHITAGIRKDDATVESVDLADPTILAVKVNDRYRNITPQTDRRHRSC